MSFRLLFIILGLSTLTTPLVQAQNTIFGQVVDSEGNAIPAVNVREKGSNMGSVTNNEGAFKLDIGEKVAAIIIISHTGFQKLEIALSSNTEEAPHILPLKYHEIKTVVIEDKRNRGTTFSKIKTKDIAKIPTPTMDFNAVLNTQLGVAMNNELSSNYSVRGGNFDENLVYVNGMEVYRPFLARSGQQEGLSFVNPDMVGSVQFSAGGFEAKYGDKLSSVLDIQYKKPESFAGSFSGSLLGTSLHLENASKGWTYIGGLRYRANGYILNSLDNQGDYKPRFFDFQGYATKQLSPKWEVGLLANLNFNVYQYLPKSRKTEFGTVNQALQLSIFFEGLEESGYATGFGTAQFANQHSESFRQTFAVSHFRTSEHETYDVIGAYFIDELERDPGSEQFGEAVRNVGIGGSLRHARNFLDAQVSTFRYRGFKSIDNKYLQFGGSVSLENIEDEIKEWELIDSAGYSTPYGSNRDEINLQYFLKSEQKVQNMRYQAYIQNGWTWHSLADHEWNLTAGVRGQLWSNNNEFLVSPRATMAFKPHWKRIRKKDSTVVQTDWVFRLSSGVYVQAPFYRELRDLNGNINNDVLAQKSFHIVGGADYNFTAWNRPFKFVGEAYYKYLWDINTYELDNIRIRYYAHNRAVGYATGLDLKVNGEFIEGIESWVSLGLLRTREDLLDDRKVDYLNSDGEIIQPGFTLNNTITDSLVTSPGFIPRPADQLVNFAMFFQDEMPNRPSYKVHVALYYGAPLPFGPPDYNRYKDILRTGGYRRVDIGFTKQLSGAGIDTKKGLFSKLKESWVTLEFFNVMDINNTINYSWLKDVSGRQYAIPNFLTGRRINLKFVARF